MTALCCKRLRKNPRALITGPSQDLNSEIAGLANKDPAAALHLCAELLEHNQQWPAKKGLNRLLGRHIQQIGQIIGNTPETQA